MSYERIRRSFLFVVGLLVAGMVLSASGIVGSEARAEGPSPAAAIAVMLPTEGSGVHGTVRFVQRPEGVEVTADIDGLAPDSVHGIHIHAFGDISDPHGKATGGHYSPEGHPHGLPPAANRHAGDLGNLKADGDGHAHLVLTVKNISVAGPRHPILGRAVIIHAKADDGGQPTGNAGARLAQGVIGLAKSD